MEVVLPGTMTVAESHDIALQLQHRIEHLEDVERAFIHVDHLVRDGFEHKVERQLARAGSKGDATPAPAALTLSADAAAPASATSSGAASPARLLTDAVRSSSSIELV